MIAAADHVRRETLVSIAINGVLSLAFFAVAFAPFDDVRISALAFDFVPQSFAIALMSVLVPGFITRRKLAAGGVERMSGRTSLPRSLIVRALLLAVTSAAAGFVASAVIGALVGTHLIAWGPGAAIKIAYGMALAAIVTPIGLRAALRQD